MQDRRELEIAARKVCELRGLDPDERIENQNGWGVTERWEIVAEEVKAIWQVMKSIEYAKDKVRSNNGLCIGIEHHGKENKLNGDQ